MVKNILQPTGDQVRAFRDRATGEPIAMLNMLKFKEKAIYEDGRDVGITGREAYSKYAQGFRTLMEPRGCRVIYAGAVRGFLIGEGEGTWDAIFIFEYPSTQVMLDMFRDKTYQDEVQPHRAAALEGQLLIECGPGFDLE